MADLTYVCLYVSYLQTLSPFTDAERGRILNAMLNYAATQRIPEFEGNERYIWPTIQAQIDRDSIAYQEKCMRNRVNGAKGGRPKKPTVISATDLFADDPEKGNENEKENDREKGKERNSSFSSSPFVPPSVEDVRTYCREHGLSVDAEQFVNHYQSNGWMVGSNKMCDWKASVRKWARKETQNGEGKLEAIFGSIGQTF